MGDQDEASLPGAKKEHLALNIAAVLLGAAFGSKVADRIAGGHGLPSVLAQIGGAIAGGLGAKAIADFLTGEKTNPDIDTGAHKTKD